MFNPFKRSVAATEPTGTAVDISGFNKVINFCLYAVVLLTPLLFLPITSEALEFNKQAFLFLGMVIILGIWVIKILTTRRVSWVKTSLDYILLIYLIIYLVSSFLSVDKVSSFLGYYGRFTGSFVSVFTFIVLYFLIVNNVRREKVIRGITAAMLWSIGLVLVYSILQLFGLYILPIAITHSVSFNPIGSLAALAIFASFAIVFVQWLWFVEPRGGKLKNLFLILITLLALAIVFLINAFVAWIILVLALIAFLAIALSVSSEHTSVATSLGVAEASTWYWKPMALLVISVLFVAFHFLPSSFNPRNLVSANLPVEIQLSNSTTWSLVGNSIKHSAKTAILGSGPGTTGIAFGDIKPESLNKSIVWSLGFDRASNEIANITIETGILGVLAFELVALAFLFYALYFLMKKPGHIGWKYAFGFFVFWLTLYITHFFYFFNTTFYFIYWMSIALFMAVTHLSEAGDDQNFSLSTSPRSTLSWMFVSLIILAGLLVGLFFASSVYGAEVAYNAGLNRLNQPNPDFTKVSNDFQQAITLNPYRDTYYLAYAQDLIFLSSVEAAKDKPDISEIQNWVAGVVSAGQRAVALSPAKASNWSALAQFYSGISPLVSGTNPQIISDWQQAIKLDPKNPSLEIQLANAYASASQIIDPAITGTGADADNDGLSDAQEAKFGCDPHNSDTNGDGISDGDEIKAGFNCAGTGRLSDDILTQYTKTDDAMLDKAVAALNIAIQLKPDLPDSYIALARVLEEEGKLDQAKTQLDSAAQQFPDNADVLFEQGRIDFNQHDFSDAEKIFKNVIVLVPNYANAHYSLGLIYQQQGDNADALAEYQKTRQINGPDVNLDKLINSLEPATPPATPGK